MDKEFIKRYIDFHTQPQIKTRAIGIYKSNKLNLIEIDKENQLAIYKVQGSKLYSISITNFLNEKLSVKCSCPYDWSDLCKHGLAALYHLEKSYSKLKSTEIKASNKTKREPNNFLEIFNAENFTKESLNLYNFENDYYFSPNKIEIDSFDQKTLTIKLTQRHQFKRIKIAKKKNIYFIKSNEYKKAQYSLKPYLFDGEYKFLKYITENNPTFLYDIFNPKALEITRQTAKKQYGLKTEKELDKYFKFAYSIQDGLTAFLKEGYYGLMPVKQTKVETNFKNLLNELTKQTEATFSIKKIAKRQHILGFLLIKDYSSNAHPYSTIILLKGEAQKKKKGLVKISPFNIVDDKKKTSISENQSSLLDLIKEYEELKYYDSEIDSNGPFINTKFKSILNLLQKEDFVFYHSSPEYFNHNYHKILKRELQELKIEKEFVVDLSFKISETDDLIQAMPIFKTQSQTIDISKNNKSLASFGTFMIADTIYVCNRFEDFRMYTNIEGNPLTMLNAYQEEFIEQYAMPLSKKWNLEFDKNIPYQITKKDLEPLNKQVFLSEEDDFLIITPQIQYSNDITTKLIENQDFFLKENFEITQFVRDTDYENNFLDFIASLHKELENQKEEGYFYIHLDLLMKDMWFYNFFEELKSQQIEIFGLKKLKKFKYSTNKAKVQTNVSSGEDWFDVDVKLSFGKENVSLKDIRKAILNKEKYIKLADDSVGILPEEWVNKMQDYFRHGEVKGDKLKISKLKFSVIDELFEGINEKEILKEIAEKKKLLLSFKKIEKVIIPKEINATLRDYQKEGLNWLHFLKKMKWGGILADDMGLGKTLQMICLLQGTVKKSKLANLIVVPTTLLFNWKAELEKFAPELKPYFHYGLSRKNDQSIFKKHQIIITTYGTMARDIEFLAGNKFNYIIIDESQAIKNPNSQRYKAAVLLKANAKIALTGTPIENNTFDLYAQMNFVNPGFLGSVKSFKDNYSMPIDKDGDKDAAEELQKLISPFLLRRTKEQVATELPPKTEDVLYCEMLPAQQKIYDAHKNEYRNKILEKIETDGLNKSKLFVLAALTKLRQICDSPLLLKDEHINTAESAKIKLLLNHINEKTAKHKILIFSQFTSMLTLIKNELDKQQIDYEYLDGKSSQKNRQKSVEHFQNNKDLRVFLISLKAGGTGLNLTEADYVYIVDPWWNPAVENQAIDRCYRIGQNKSVMAYRMICKGTIEEKIIKLQNKKKQLASDIIQTDEKIMKTIDKDSLFDLFS